jgi:hypothetical protein
VVSLQYQSGVLKSRDNYDKASNAIYQIATGGEETIRSITIDSSGDHLREKLRGTRSGKIRPLRSSHQNPTRFQTTHPVQRATPPPPPSQYWNLLNTSFTMSKKDISNFHTPKKACMKGAADYLDRSEVRPLCSSVAQIALQQLYSVY